MTDRAAGWRALRLFWAGTAAVALATVAVLAVLGAPDEPAPRLPMPRSLRDASGNAPWAGPPIHVGAPIAAPDPLLMVPAPHHPGRFLPRIGLAGRRPEQYYAASSNPHDPQSKVGLIVAGFGLDRSDSRAAARLLPAAVDFAVSAYADEPEEILPAVRAAGHEYLASLPMEPDGAPSDDEGPHALLTTAAPADNARNLEWALSRLGGYAGVTGASDGQYGGRFAASPTLMEPVAAELAGRGLFYIDPRPQADMPDRVAGRAVDLVIGDEAAADEIDSKLAELERMAQQRGSAIGLIDRPSPVVVARLLAWSGGLGAGGVSLIPVSALLQLSTPAP